MYLRWDFAHSLQSGLLYRKQIPPYLRFHASYKFVRFVNAPSMSSMYQDEKAYISCVPTSKGVSEIPWTQRQLEVTPETCGVIGERTQVILVWVRAPYIGYASHPRREEVTHVGPQIMNSLWLLDSKMLKNTPIGGVNYKILKSVWGTMPTDNALGQQWYGNSVRDCQGFERHNFLNTYPNGASEEFIGIYAKSRCQWSGQLLGWKTKCRNYRGLKFLGACSSNGYLAPTLSRKAKYFLAVRKGPCTKS